MPPAIYFQMRMGGEHKFAISPEEYIFAGIIITKLIKYFYKFSAIALYLGKINIFLYILKIMGQKK